MKSLQHLITGCGSFAGLHLAAHILESHGGVVTACGRTRPAALPAEVEWRSCDIRNAIAVRTLVEEVKPDVVYHLAASSGEGGVSELIRTNVEGTWNLLQSCHEQGGEALRVLLVGSAAEFGEMSEDELGLSETRQAMPGSFYGCSRQAAMELGRVALQQWGLQVFLCRPFNMIGPGLPDKYAPPMILKRLREAMASGATEFLVRDADAVRDFVDVRDVVRAWVGIVESGIPGVPYSIGTGIGTTMRGLTEELAMLLGARAEVVAEPAMIQTSRTSIRRSVADISRLQRDIGWTPRISLRKSLQDMLTARNPQ